MSAAAKLYSPQVLALAVELTRWPAQPELPLHGEARSPTCGSTIAIDLALDDRGAIASLGMRVRACAIGQAAAALFARNAVGKTQEQLGSVLQALELWLVGEGPEPDWPELNVIAPAREFPARHGAVLLPWRAALASFEHSQD